MEVEFKPMYSCKLVEDMERMRRDNVRNTLQKEKYAFAVMHTDQVNELHDWTMALSITRYCQMGVNRRWHDYYKELTRNVNAIDAGNMDEVTMPELITDVDAWSDEDKMVYKALKAAKLEGLKK